MQDSSDSVVVYYTKDRVFLFAVGFQCHSRFSNNILSFTKLMYLQIQGGFIVTRGRWFVELNRLWMQSYKSSPIMVRKIWEMQLQDNFRTLTP